MTLDRSEAPHPRPLPVAEREKSSVASAHSNLRDALFSPRSVAIVGQSDDASKAAGRPLKFLRRIGYAGRVYPINPRRETVLGERAWPALAALPESPDHAYIVTSTQAAVAAVEECGALGVKVATVLADGFAEVGAEGIARETRLRETCARTGIRIVGPSSLGVVDLRTRVMLTANAAFDEKDFPLGRVFAASHSGSMIGALMSRGKARGAGFAGFVSVGNEVDLSLGEICAATLDDPDIDGYMLFLETMRHADSLRRFAHSAAERGKPIIAYKLGRSATARELAVSHTGALAGEDDVADQFLKSCGIARVDTLEGLIEGLPLLSRVPVAARGGRKRVGVVTTTAGGATMVVDPLASRGVTIEPASADTLARLAAAGVEVKPARLVDLTIAGARYQTMKAALDILTTAPEFDLVLAVIGSSARSQPETTVRPIIDSAGAARPLAAFLVPDAPQASAMLSSAGVPNFRTPEACADAIAAALSRQPPRPLPARTVAKAASSGPVLDELAAGALLDRLGIARAPSVALEAGIARAPTLPFAYPVAVKVLCAEIAHKTDVGGVALGVADGDALLAAIRKIAAAVAERSPGTRVDRVLVQPMMSGLGEVLLGYRVDRDVGALIMVAAGGVLTEIVRDRSLRLAPIDLATAHEMIAEVRALIALAGYRGRPAGDLDALAHAMVALSQLADDANIAEAEINPLIVREAGQGVIAVDALVKLARNA
ncbi:MAG: acetate--CoA ligase family protein [Hyphomicrobiales bacterium]|nr:acetate--CoA ligase family protein [Hyphomicrobiales bacterium]MBV8320162.1 acetate--CoA ligase family protein [Hyphomicrobiales bacterium]